MDWNDAKERIRNSATIPYILESWYKVTLNGRNRGRCPLCNYEKDKRTFWVSKDEQGFYCHHCRKGGDIFMLVMELENMEFKAALTKLSDHTGIEFELTPEQKKEFQQEQERAAALLHFAQYWNEKLTDKVKEYLIKRKIENKYINSHCIGFIPEKATYQGDKQDLHHLKQMGLMYNDKDVNHQWYNRLFITFWKNGQIVYFVGHRGFNGNLKPPQRFPSLEEMGNKPVVGTCKGDSVLIVEGTFDFLTADQEPELKSVMAILGTSSVFNLPGHIKTVELCFDWDKAGFEFIDKHGLHFASMGKTVKVVTRPNDLPEDKKDLNDYVQAGGKIESLEKIDLAEWYLNQLKESPHDETIKKKFYKSILKVGLVEQETYLNRLHKEIFKGQGVGKRAITKEFLEFKKAEKDSNEQNTFTDAISGNDFKLPNGYAFTGNKLIGTENGEIISEKRIYISRLLTDTTENETYCEVVSSYNNQTIASIEPLFILSNRKEIVLLSKKNFPITSENAGKLVKFLNRFKYENEQKLKSLNASSQLGWQGDSFLFPDQALNSSGEIVPGHFIGADPPREAFTAKGDLNTYVKFIRDIKTDLEGDRWVIPVFVIGATLASFILELLNEKPIIIHFTETTGRGKTSIMKLAASVYGKSDYQNNWNDTPTALVRKAVQLKNFPLLLNEMGAIAEQEKKLDAILYTLAEGQSRTKATMDSTNETTPIRRFFNLIISNGETSLLTGNEPSGVLMRVNEFFKTLGGINHKFIERLEKTIKKNYGKLIDPFLKKVIELRSGKSCVNIEKNGQKIEVKSLEGFPYFEPLDETDSPNSGNYNRKIKSLQSVYIALCIAEDVFKFGYDPAEVVGYVYDINKKYIEENINRAKRVMNALEDFYQEHRSNFINLSIIDIATDEEIMDKVGNTNKTVFGYKRGKELLIIPGVFNSHFLKSFGSDGKHAKVILRELKEEKYIDTEKDRYQKMTRIGDKSVRLITFPNFFDNENEMPVSISNEWSTQGEHENALL